MAKFCGVPRRRTLAGSGQPPRVNLPGFRGNVADDFREPQQAGAEAQPGSIGRIQVDSEAHPSAFDVKLDDARRLREVLAVASCSIRPTWNIAALKVA